MTDPKYQNQSIERKLCINAILLAALSEGKPAGLVQAMRDSMTFTKDTSWFGGVIPSLADTPYEKGEMFLNRMRDALAALPDGQLPKLSDKVEKPEQSLGVQRYTFQDIIGGLASGENYYIRGTQRLKDLSKALVYQIPEGSNLPEGAHNALVQFIGRETVAVCQNPAIADTPKCGVPATTRSADSRGR